MKRTKQAGAARAGREDERARFIASLIASIANAVISVDEKRIITSANPAALKMLGYAKGELVGQPVNVIYPDGIPGDVARLLSGKTRGADSREIDSTLKKKNGELIHVWRSLSVLADSGGKRYGIVSVSSDMSWFREYEQKQRYMAQLVECAAHCIVSTDKQGIITSVNRACEKMFGYRAKELIGKSASILQSEQVSDDVRARFNKLAAKGESWEAESLGRRKNSETFPIWIATSYLRDEKGEIKGAVGISRDMTRFKEYEDTLRHMADLVESAALCIISTDTDGMITSINRAGERMFGHTARRILGKHISILHSGGNDPRLVASLMEKALRGEAWEGEILDRRKDGSTFPIWLSTSYLFDSSGKRTGSISIIRDITEQKKTEEELRYMAELVESAGHSIISTDRDGNIKSINTAGQHMFGYRPEELIGKPVSILEPREGLPEHLIRTFSGKRKRGENWEAEGIGRRKNGEVFPLWLATSYLRDEQGRIKGAVGISRDLTRFKEYEDGLRYMAELVESAALCIISTDGTGYITSINRAGEAMFGYRAPELIGKHISILNAKGNAPALIINLVEKAARAEAWEGEILDRKKDGTVFHIWISTSYLFDSSRKRTGGISIIRDITEQKKTEEELRYMAELVESAGHSIISTDRDGNIKSINTAGQHMFGYRPEELIGKPVSILEPREGLPEHLIRTFSGKRKRGENWEAEGIGRRKNGEVFPLWLATSYLRDEQGRIKGAVGISRDISLFKDYQEKTGYMAELVEKASMGIISTDPHNTIVSINKAGELMYGYKAEELIGRDISVIYSDKNPPGLLSRIKEKADALEPWSAELCRRKKDGSDFISWLSSGYLLDESGNLKAKVCIERDVTEQREIEKRLADAEHLANIGELAAGVAHEIRNPLGGIHTSVKMLLDQEGQAIGPDEMSLLRIIEKESSRLRGIVNDFLRFGRPQEPIMSKAEIGPYLRDLIDSMKRGKIVGEGVEVEMEIPRERLAVCIDRDHMQQVFLNLVINAVHAMDGKGRLRLAVVGGGGLVEISVEDTGCGIPNKDIENIFKPFFSKKKGGSGLGLAIVRRIVLTHRGTIRCESGEGTGTRFTISLPLAEERP